MECPRCGCKTFRVSVFTEEMLTLSFEPDTWSKAPSPTEGQWRDDSSLEDTYPVWACCDGCSHVVTTELAKVRAFYKDHEFEQLES